MRPTIRHYYDDSYTHTFTARVSGVGAWQEKPAVALEESYFYPESGGQLGDRGTLGGATVTDVQVDDDGIVWHVFDGAAPEGELPAAIDAARRFEHMQQHTGQHVLSAALERMYDCATISSSLGEERDVLEIDRREIDWRTVDELERIANGILWEDREIRTHWTDDAGIGAFPLRRPPKVQGRIRVVEITDWDFSACGGTHTRRTGEVGVIKIVGWEKVRGNVRLSFHCGVRALRDHAWRTETMLEAAKRRTLKDRDLIAHLERTAAERDAVAKQLRDLRLSLLANEAAAAVGTPPRGVARCVSECSREEARAFALECLSAGAPWVVSAADGAEPVLVLGRAKDRAADLKALLPELLALANGKGGGSPELLQLSAADGAAARKAFECARTRVPALLGDGGATA